jgi:hypothetical protein
MILMKMYNGSKLPTGFYVKIPIPWQFPSSTAAGLSFHMSRIAFLLSAHLIVLNKKGTGFAETP